MTGKQHDKAVEARPDVPSVEEIQRKMHQQRRNDPRPDGVLSDARVAHEMMLQLAPRKRMMIEGMDWPAIRDEMERVWANQRHGECLWPTQARECARVAHRLANTPAEDATESDAVAMDLYWNFITCDGSNRGWAYKEHLWNAVSEKTRNYWRGVAAKMGKERGI